VFGKFAAKVSKKAESAKLSPPFYVAFARKAKLCTTFYSLFFAVSRKKRSCRRLPKIFTGLWPVLSSPDNISFSVPNYI
jgi:hypothetical protein